MIKSAPVTAYDNNGRPRFKERGRPGCYIITKNGKTLYVGHSKRDIYKTLYRHFQSWNDRTQVRVTYNPNDTAIKVRIIYTNTPAQAATLERALIIKREPRDNPQKLLNYTTTEREETIYEQFTHLPTETIKTFEGETPF